jgi:hypothetical protein
LTTDDIALRWKSHELVHSARQFLGFSTLKLDFGVGFGSFLYVHFPTASFSRFFQRFTFLEIVSKSNANGA